MSEEIEQIEINIVNWYAVFYQNECTAVFLREIEAEAHIERKSEVFPKKFYRILPIKAKVSADTDVRRWNEVKKSSSLFD